ncbi:PHP domain-containing protein [Pochonia chlamydosporia 170]|uniref:PHP domain-containing protein n=1 Tax=Pochonia chlamydosporia 170 TaxID=1380566 RepID=A0A179EZZ4_METCM|nr:PHP domain-containing protein [Pochonia chlamydosporia 170]OAQ58728.1 PHP domain-containing protein [Pochonia chlamydosporia 170]
MVANDGATPGYIPGLLAPGTWNVILGVYQVKTTESSYTIEITLDTKQRQEFQPCPAPTRAHYSTSLRRLPGYSPSFQWLKGDFHVHSVYSDGKLDLSSLIDKALKRNLDFIFSTEHNTNSANLVCGSHSPEGFLVGRGIEVTTYKGHWNAIGLLPHQMIDPVIHDSTNVDASLTQAVREVHKSDGFAIINHPFAECRCCAWDFTFHNDMDAIEVWNGPWKRHPDDESNEKAVQKWDELLRCGNIFPATGGSDLHEPQFEIGEPVTRVLADENSVTSIIRGLRDRRVYLTRHPSYEIAFTVRHGEKVADIGGWVEATGLVKAVVCLKGFPGGEIRLISEAGIVCRTSESWLEMEVMGRYLRVEVRDGSGEMLGLTNPIWVLGPKE